MRWKRDVLFLGSIWCFVALLTYFGGSAIIAQEATPAPADLVFVAKLFAVKPDGKTIHDAVSQQKWRRLGVPSAAPPQGAKLFETLLGEAQQYAVRVVASEEFVDDAWTSKVTAEMVRVLRRPGQKTIRKHLATATTTAPNRLLQYGELLLTTDDPETKERITLQLRTGANY